MRPAHQAREVWRGPHRSKEIEMASMRPAHQAREVMLRESGHPWVVELQ